MHAQHNRRQRAARAVETDRPKRKKRRSHLVKDYRHADVYQQVRVLSDVGIARAQNSDSRRVKCPLMHRQQRHHIGGTSGAPRRRTWTVVSSSKRRSGKDPRTGQRAHPRSAPFQKPTPLNEATRRSKDLLPQQSPSPPTKQVEPLSNEPVPSGTMDARNNGPSATQNDAGKKTKKWS